MLNAARKIDQYFEEVDCLLCGSSASVPATPVMPDTDIYGEAEQPYRDMRYQYVSCADCGTVYLRRRICQQELDYFYNNEYHCYQSYDERGFIFKHLALAVTRGKIRTLSQLFPGPVTVPVPGSHGTEQVVLQVRFETQVVPQVVIDGRCEGVVPGAERRVVVVGLPGVFPVLPLVAGFPRLRVLCLIRHPGGL